MRLSLAAFALTILLGLSACESTRGVQRAVRLPGRLPQEVVMAAIRDVPGTEVARYRHASPTVGYGRYENVYNNSVDQFVYISEARRVDGVIEIGGNEREGTRLRMYCNWSGTPPAEQVNATRQLMDEIYAALRRRAPELVPPKERVLEEVR